MVRKILCLSFVMSVAMSQTVLAASGADGWPAADAVAAPKPVVKTAARAVQPKTAAEPPAATPAAASAAVVAPPVAPGDLVRVLQEQSALLAQLAGKLDEQRHVIETQQSAIRALEARTAAGATASAVSAPAASAVAAPPPALAAAVMIPAAALPPIVVETGGARLKIGGLFQGWYTAGSGGAIDTFRMRRAEVKFTGDLSAQAKWTVVVDPAKALAVANTLVTVAGQSVVSASSVTQSGTILQDAFVSVGSSAFTVDLGQQKLPLSMEGTQSSARLETVERALFMEDKARGAGYGDVRDLGVMAKGKVIGGQLEYYTGLFDGLGEGMNTVDANYQKDVAGRVVYHPRWATGLQFGGSFARDVFSAAGVLPREREGAEFRYDKSIIGLKGEVMFGQDGLVPRHGGYVQVTDRLHKSLQAVFRFDTFDPDTRSDATAATVTERDFLSGVTYSLPGGVTLQLDYIRKTFVTGVTPSSNVFMTNLQTSF